MPAAKYCIITVGLSHSGKTTLVHKICEQYPEMNYQHVETDTIRAMCHQYIPEIYHHKRGGGDIAIPQTYTNKLSLTARFQHTLLEYLIDYEQNIILSNGNTYKQGREKICELLKKHGYTIIMIYVNTDESIILERLQHNTSKDPALMLTSKTYLESYEKQKRVFEMPTPNEADYFLEVDGIDHTAAIKQLHHKIQRKK